MTCHLNGLSMASQPLPLYKAIKRKLICIIHSELGLMFPIHESSPANVDHSLKITVDDIKIHWLCDTNLSLGKHRGLSY